MERNDGHERAWLVAHHPDLHVRAKVFPGGVILRRRKKLIEDKFRLRRGLNAESKAEERHAVPLLFVYENPTQGVGFERA